jgi:hypothetical protein
MFIKTLEMLCTFVHVLCNQEKLSQHQQIANFTAKSRLKFQIDLTLAGVTGPEPVKCSRNVRIIPDTSMEEALKKVPYDILILPGGPIGAKHLAEVK